MTELHKFRITGKCQLVKPSSFFVESLRTTSGKQNMINDTCYGISFIEEQTNPTYDFL